MVTPTARRLAVGVLCADFPVSLSRACTALGVARSSWRYVSRRDDGPLRAALRDVAHCRPRFGYRRLHVLLQRAGWRCNHKRVYRLYREERLAVRRRRRRKLAAGCRIVLPVPTRPHERWSMDFMGDTLANGRTTPFWYAHASSTRLVNSGPLSTTICFGSGRATAIRSRIRGQVRGASVCSPTADRRCATLRGRRSAQPPRPSRPRG